MFSYSRNSVFALLALLLIWGFYWGSNLDPAPSSGTKSFFGFKSRDTSPLSPHVHTYFDQIFSADPAPIYDFPGLTAACARAEWKAENKDVYVKCGGMAAGMTSIISQVKVCLKMAVDTGVHLILPAMPLRDSENLTNFNFFNGSAYMTYDEWFDAQHLVSSMARACPKMKIRHPKEEGTPSMPIAKDWSLDISSAPGFRPLSGFYWVGRPFKAWFDEELLRLRFLDSTSPETKAGADKSATSKQVKGVTVLSIASQFLLFRITDDATGRELALWNDLSSLIRFKEAPRTITTQVLSLIDRPYIGVHFRTERDNIWSSFENQLRVDLDALDKVWARYGSPGKEKPFVYLACGEESQIEKFAAAAALKGWTVTSKYGIAKNDPDTLKQLKELPFDFQGAVDMGIMLKSHFFLGITGSAFSSTMANMRDSTGRYRGSSLMYSDDGNARTHLFNDGDASGYPCCL